MFCSNQVKYEAMIMRLRILASIVYDYDNIQVMDDSQFLVKQIFRVYKCLNLNLQRTCETANI